MIKERRQEMSYKLYHRPRETSIRAIHSVNSNTWSSNRLLGIFTIRPAVIEITGGAAQQTRTVIYSIYSAQFA